MAASPEQLAFSYSGSSETATLAEGSDPHRCPHIASAFADADERARLVKKFKSVVAWKAQNAHDAIHPAKRRKISSPACGTCATTMPRPFTCLHCGYAGCWKDEHVTEHMKDEDHTFCVDVKLGAVFCIDCDDFIYEPDLESLFHATVLSVEERGTRFQISKRGRETYRPWTPTAKDTAALENTTSLPCQGRRGLLNLGQTCFLNVILQSFVHNPLLRNYFLSDKHNFRTCKTGKDCTSCEMDKLFAEVYSPSSTPFGPTSLLAATWRAASSLSGYAQQDAHECLIALLNSLHTSSRGSTNVSCNCVVHSTFAGQLQSDVRCERCGNNNSTLDPCLDVSLGLGAGMNTLAGCLKRFTQPEKLGPKQYSCPKCGKASQESSKRLSIRKLPPVLSFQFKRFEQKSVEKGTAQKIDAPVRIPASINMAPYTTLGLETSARGQGGADFAYPGPEALYEYDLFAVVNHEGQIDNGHYTNFARFQDAWYRFDDEKVTPSTLRAVLSSPVPIYMAFYVKRRLDYKPNTTPSYVMTREAEAVRERERERSEKARKEHEQRERQQHQRELEEKEEREERDREREVEDELLALS
ncbi:cysteine proteinase [Artomyces pyxidatus]|uniref:Cysteine proteinase n=1 Tax=Artomyces pyxidatus TaxID=48021 RepID=A0ACB8SPU7_9AGAM|nr:cysteine proteinase [Artomyces pyxidatus]